MAKICLYHDDCFDGTAAAWVVRQVYRKVTLVPAVYNEPVPVELDDSVDLILVDFSYKPPVLKTLLTQVKSLTLLDHHPDVAGYIEEVNEWLEGEGAPYKDRFRPRYRKDISGALLAWRHYFSGTPAPTLLRTIDDYDRWVFKYAETRQIMAGLHSYPKDLEVFDMLMHLPEDELYARLRHDGDTALRLRAMEIAWAMEHTYRDIWFGERQTPLVSVPKYLMNDTLDAILRSRDFEIALGYYDSPFGRVYSIRTKGAVDARDFARPFGGSGHEHAAGFRVPYGHSMTEV